MCSDLTNNKKKVLIVDDSKMIRNGLSEIFSLSNEFEVVGEAANGEDALTAIKTMEPDVVTLDVVMPGMNGLTALKHIMIETPRPTVMLSSLTSDGSRTAFDALRYGAVDFISKPSRDEEGIGMEMQGEEILKKLNAATGVNVGVASYIRPTKVSVSTQQVAASCCDQLVGLGAAEGGYSALLKILPKLTPANAAYIAVLYVEEEHLDAFIGYLNEYSCVRVKRAEHEETLEAGVCYLSSGSDYLTVHQESDHLVFHINPAPFSTRRGSIDRLFFSIAEVMESRAVGVILSGAGGDGVEGLQEISRVGGTVIVQDANTSLAKEMPAAATEAIQPRLTIADTEVAKRLNELLMAL